MLQKCSLVYRENGIKQDFTAVNFFDYIFQMYILSIHKEILIHLASCNHVLGACHPPSKGLMGRLCTPWKPG